jgi:hypothetical protein
MERCEATRFARFENENEMAFKARKGRAAAPKPCDGEHREFASELIKKLNGVAVRNRIIHRSLHSLSGRMERKSKSSRPGTCTASKEVKNSRDSNSFLEYDYFREDDVPQQQWDELFESAFTAISSSSMDVFDVL